MNVLLLSMPDAFEHMAPVAIRMPNGALASLAGNVDRHHRVAVADLLLAQGRVGPTVERLVADLQPEVVGLSVMTFQRATAFEVARLVRHLRPETRIVAGSTVFEIRIAEAPTLAEGDTIEVDIDLGFEVRKGRFVTFERNDLGRVARPTGGIASGTHDALQSSGRSFRPQSLHVAVTGRAPPRR